MDAFYASVELRRRPELRGKPVVVCGSGPRAVVTTASYEARRLAGIHSAMPAATARRRLPDAVYIQPDFTAYREASREVMAILRRNAETVEVVGLDEAYVDLTGLFAPKATMRRIAAEIREDTRLTCSIGISENRLLAKITSELGKPAGLVVLSREQALERFAGRLAGARSRDRAENGGEAPADGDLRPGDASRLRPRGPRGGVRAEDGRLAPIPGRVRGRDPDRGLAQDQVAVDRDDLRHRHRRPRSSRRVPAGARRGALPAARRARSRGQDDRDQGPARRLDHGHPLPHRRAARPTTPPWSSRPRSTCCAPTPRRAPSASSASGWPVSPRRRPRTRRRSPTTRRAGQLRLGVAGY